MIAFESSGEFPQRLCPETLAQICWSVICRITWGKYGVRYVNCPLRVNAVPWWDKISLCLTPKFFKLLHQNLSLLIISNSSCFHAMIQPFFKSVQNPGTKPLELAQSAETLSERLSMNLPILFHFQPGSCGCVRRSWWSSSQIDNVMSLSDWSAYTGNIDYLCHIDHPNCGFFRIIWLNFSAHN